MKVNDVIKKINYAGSDGPVYLERWDDMQFRFIRRKVTAADTVGYYYNEASATVESILVDNDGLVIRYAWKR